ncbi:MAG: bifunctional UDP-N-acetylglucosamine diphosphorylase/glucosamine-1-phosphate N-acetyltransferase GlmU [Betaproteobacteria bacterium]|nr:bifunctional UDP-N-acetylglucosamine diphosphorylase/glucosamine-1-phosphate N-acetyltransferase GlmU [Betaproteobacteria bacterium]
MALNVVIMAAGKGTRMKSAIPKVLHRIAGTSLLEHVMRTATTLGSSRTVVITGHEAAQVEASLAGRDVQFVRQEPQLGTGHAVQQAVPALPDAHETTLVLNGDVPLIGAATVQRLVDACGGRRLALLTIELADPTGYGRVVRAGDAVRAIVEHKDAKPEQLAIRETYTGVMAAPTALLKRWVMALKNDNKQREYYLTDVVAAAVAEGVPVVAEHATSETEVAGVNSPLQLAELERAFQRAQAEALMEAGVRLADPARLDVRGTLTCGADVEIDVGCIFEGRVHLADGVRIGAHCVIRDSRIGAGTQVQPFTHMREAVVGERAEVGPFARLRPGANLGPEVHIGNFVEVKNSTLAAGAKANHLAYLGDATVGARVNYGAGSITANYDGANKHRTVIGDDAHIGSNCVLVAPVTIGAGATIGGGSTINKDAPAGQLTVARAKQMSLSGWKRPQKAKKA